MASGMAFGSPGRPTAEPVVEQEPSGSRWEETFRGPLCSDMGNNCFGLHQGERDFVQQEVRGHGLQGHSAARGKAKSQSKAKAKPREAATRRRRRSELLSPPAADTASRATGVAPEHRPHTVPYGASTEATVGPSCMPDEFIQHPPGQKFLEKASNLFFLFQYLVLFYHPLDPCHSNRFWQVLALSHLLPLSSTSPAIFPSSCSSGPGHDQRRKTQPYG